MTGTWRIKISWAFALLFKTALFSALIDPPKPFHAVLSISVLIFRGKVKVIGFILTAAMILTHCISAGVIVYTKDINMFMK